MDEASAVSLRPLGLYDLDLAAALHGACFEVPWNAQDFAELLAVPGAAGVCALRGAEPVGLLLLLLQPPDAEILTLGVLPALRRRGIGRTLLDTAAGQARQAGAARLLLEVAANNEAATSLYRQAGFRPLNRRRHYYRRAGSPAIDAEVLVLELGIGGQAAPVPAGTPGN